MPHNNQSLANLQRDVGHWNPLAWGDRTLERHGCKLGEEAGEVLKAIIRSEENRPGGTTDDIAKELADTIIAACMIAAHCGIDLHEAVLDRFYNDVQFRQDPVSGRVPWGSPQSQAQLEGHA